MWDEKRAEAEAASIGKVMGGAPMTTGGAPVLPPASPVTGRLPVATVERLHRLLGGDARVEEMILRFIAERYGAKSLLYLPARVANEALKRPADFIRAAKLHCEPELSF